ncbi:Longitudinals lacking protein, isoform G [Trachymyrmex septentrionalis]|uniref:Longitudinals lacking protein, isoform G n=1 Tax=Trachymyrmex septentrionalis TaxID=34720 RepID=A0A195EVY1_9HYME|nr:Longitudinals lacking protein, isoform G [Trachymyrmex septentrionalis]
MEDDQQFCLRWNNHQSTLIQNFDTLLESGTLVDCTLAAEGKTLKAHKVVLSACSPYFECLLSEHYDKHPVFILKDVKFKELKAMMDYMYRGEVNISQDQLAALLKAAESLQIKGLSESKTAGSSKTESRPQKTVSQPTAPSLDIPHASSGLTIEKNKVPRQSLAQSSVGDIPEDSASPQVSKGLSSREGSQSPTSRKRKRFRRRSLTEDSTIENQDASNSSDMPQQMGVPALGIAPVADEKVHADPTDSLGRSALMTQLTKPADEMLQLPLEKPEPNDNLIEPKSEYLDDAEEGVEDLTLDEDMNDLNDIEQDNNRAGPSHDPAQHPGGGAGARSRSRGNFGIGDDGDRNGGGGAPWASHFLECNKVPNMRRPRPDADVAALLKSLANKQGRKYSLDSVKMSLEAILQQGVSTTQASEMYGINRSTLQFYLKKLNVVRRRWKHQPSSPIFTPVQPRRTYDIFTHDLSPGMGSWHVTGDRSNAGGVVGSVATPGTGDEVFLAAQEAAQAHRDSQGHDEEALEMKMRMQKKKLTELLRSSDFSIGAAHRAFLRIHEEKEFDDVRREKRNLQACLLHVCEDYIRSGTLLSFNHSLAFHVKEDSNEWRRVVCSRDSCGGPHGVSESFLGYRCSRCDRRYSVQYSLERHQRYECGVEKQFSCGTCRRRFTRVDIMRSHQKRTGHRLTPYTRLVKVSPLDRHVSATEVFPREHENESHQQRQQQQRQRRGRGGINNSSMSICRS